MNQETNYENVVRCGIIYDIWELRETKKMPQMDIEFSKFSGVDPQTPVVMTEI